MFILNPATYSYTLSQQTLLHTKDLVLYRSSDGMSGAVGCLLLYFILRYTRMFSVKNVKTMCKAFKVNVKCAWVGGGSV